MKPTEKEIEEIVGVGCYKKFKRFKLNTLVAKDKNLYFCTTADCETVQDVRNKDGNNCVICSGCN